MFFSWTFFVRARCLIYYNLEEEIKCPLLTVPVLSWTELFNTLLILKSGLKSVEKKYTQVRTPEEVSNSPCKVEIRVGAGDTDC